MEKLKIIGTGLTGLVGSRIVELLGGKYQFVDFSLDNGVDITDSSKLASAFTKHKDAKIVLHLAAYTDVDKSWEQAGDKKGPCYRVNVLGTTDIARLCRLHGQHLIHISTDFVFDGVKKEPYVETDKPNPIEWYGQTKYQAEQAVRQSGCSYTILRIAFPYKIKPSAKEAYVIENSQKIYKQDLVRKIITKLTKNETLHLWHDQLICPTLIDDIALAVDKLCQQKPGNEILHCVGSEAISPYLLGQKIAKIFAFDSKLVVKSSLADYLAGHPGVRPYQEKLVLSNEKLYNMLGFKPVKISEGLKKYENQ